MAAAKTSILEDFKLNPAEILGILAILVVAGFFRLTGITWSLPSDGNLFSYHSNENFIVKTTFMLNIFTGNMEPNNFVYGTHFIYVNYFLFLVASALGLTDLTHPLGWAGVAAQPLYLMGRGLSVFYSLAYLPLLYFLGRNHFNRWVGFLAALFAALSPLLIYDAHFVTVDSCMTFWILVTFVLFTIILKDDRPVFITAAGLATGFAMGVKYVPFLLGVPALICLAWPLHSLKQIYTLNFLKKILRYGMATTLGFFITVPYALFAPKNFISQMKATHNEFHQQSVYLMFKDAGGGFSFFMSKDFPMALGWPLYLCALLGFFVVLFQVVKNLQNDNFEKATTGVAMLLLTWVVVYLGFFCSFDIYFIRYLDPVAPFFCFFAAIFFAQILTLTRPSKFFRFAVFALILVVTTYTALAAWARTKTFTGVDPRDQAAQWIFKNAKAGEQVALNNFDFFRSPPVAPPEITRQENTPGQTVFVVSPKKTIYDVVHFTETLHPLPKYFLLNFTFDWAPSLRLKDPGILKTKEFVEANYDLIQIFSNDMQVGPFNFQPTFDIFDWRYVNPIIHLYQLKEG